MAKFFLKNRKVNNLKKISKLKKIQIELNKKAESIKKFNKENKEFNLFKSDFFEILITGLFINLSLLLFGFKISLIKIISFGTLWFLLNRKILPEIKSLISSFSLIKITR